jgi:hypothetical protein
MSKGFHVSWDYDVRKLTMRIVIEIDSDFLLDRPRDPHSLAHLVDYEQFVGMLEDVVCLKLGLQLPARPIAPERSDGAAPPSPG